MTRPVGTAGQAGDGPHGDHGAAVANLVASHVVDVPDFPKPGVQFKDLTPLFADGTVFRQVIDAIVAKHRDGRFDAVAGIEARGFIIASAVAYTTGAGLIPVRKAGKLPRPAASVSYELEYGEATLEIGRDAFRTGDRVLVVDDVLATGGTAQATAELVERAGGTVTALSVLLELEFLGGRRRLAGREVDALLTV